MIDSFNEVRRVLCCIGADKSERNPFLGLSASNLSRVGPKEIKQIRVRIVATTVRRPMFPGRPVALFKQPPWIYDIRSMRKRTDEFDVGPPRYLRNRNENERSRGTTPQTRRLNKLPRRTCIRNVQKNATRPQNQT